MNCRYFHVLNISMDIGYFLDPDPYQKQVLDPSLLTYSLGESRSNPTKKWFPKNYMFTHSIVQ